jgi:hypothetical protein
MKFDFLLSKSISSRVIANWSQQEVINRSLISEGDRTSVRVFLEILPKRVVCLPVWKPLPRGCRWLQVR